MAYRPTIVSTRNVLSDHDVGRNYVRSNIESQQPRPYYSIVGRLGHFLPHRTQISELRFWRLISVIFALVIVLATARIGETFFGAKGIAAAALLLSLPTWLTLVVRASNDAFACAMLAVAIAFTASAPARTITIVAEAVAWALALAAKLYTWPAFVVALIFWKRQRASRARVATVIAASAVSVVWTIASLAGGRGRS